MNEFDIQPILESIFFVSDSTVKLEALVKILPEWSEENILDGIDHIQKRYEEDSRGMELVEVAGGYQFRTKPKWAEWVNRLKQAKPLKLSQSALETLAIIAYRQPIIRPVIEEIRGVDSGWVLRTLLEKGLIRMIGRKDIPGRPIIYGTTKTFLELFSLNTLSDLPIPKEIQPPHMPEEISKEEILKVKGKVEAQNEIEEKVEVDAETEAETNAEVQSPVIQEVLPVDEVRE